MYFIIRTNKKGGGVALYIDKSNDSKPVSYLSFAIDNIMECITVEIEMDKSKNIIISCIYRTQGSCIDTCRVKLSELYDGINNKKTVFVCGDVNIDLFNPLENNPTTEFINTMYSMTLYPSITRPSRITSHSATLIDNIFTNVMDRNIVSGLLINDISDHLPVFATIQSRTMTNNDVKTNILIRHKTQRAIHSFKDLKKSKLE